MTDNHPCEVCGAPYAPYGFMQANRTYRWYCGAHRLESYKLPDLAAEPSLPGQGDLLAGHSIDREAAWARYRDGVYSWAQKYEAWIRYQVPFGASGGVAGERWRFAFEKIMGPPPDDHVVGHVIKTLRDGGYVEYTGEWGRPRDPKSKGSEKRFVRRTHRQ